MTAGGVHVYAKKARLHEAMATTDLKQYAIVKLRDAELGHIGQAVAEIAEALVNELGPYGIKPEGIAALKTAASAFTDAKSARNESVSDKQGLKTEMLQRLAATDDLLDSIDRLMVQFQETDPGFLSAYRDARKLRISGGRHRKTDPPIVVNNGDAHQATANG
jgi:hypothetical protein